MIKGTFLIVFVLLAWNCNLCLTLVFSKTKYEFTVKENVPVHSIVAEVTASGAGENGTVRYSFAPSTLHTNGYLFGIEEETGKIYLKGQLDRERQTSYQLRVAANKEGTNSDAAYSTVKLTVEDVNDNAPVIMVNTLTESGGPHAEVRENAPPGTFVAYLTVVDPDMRRNGQVTCYLQTYSFSLQKLYDSDTEFKVVTRMALDREMKSTYEIIVSCQDKGSPRQTSLIKIMVHVTDQNDHRPYFSKRIYSTRIAENNEVPSYLLSVQATDRDAGRNAEIVYSIDEDGSALATVDQGGQIRAKIQLDYEKYHQIQFGVIAADRGDPAYSSTTTVVVDIDNQNDNVPEFERRSYSFGLFEGLPSGTQVGQVIATDADGSPYDKFTYKLQDSSDGGSFRVDPGTGFIYTNAILDWEEKSSYHLVIEAIEEDENTQMKNSVSVSIYLADKNDNAPEIAFPNE